MSRFLLQAAKVAVEAVTETAAVNSKAVSPLLKEGLLASRPAAEIAAQETAAVSPFAREAAAALSQPAAEGARKGLLTLGKDFKPTGLKIADSAETTIRQGRTGKLVRVEERTFAAAANRSPRATLNSAAHMTETEAQQYLTSLMSSQERVLAQNLKISQRDPDSIGKFAQFGIFKPLQNRFDALKTNKDLKLFAVGDSSAIDAAGADALLVNMKNKNMWLVDIKPKPYLDPKSGELVARGHIPTARSNSVVEYDGTLFQHTPKGWTFNQNGVDFRRMIDQNAGLLVGLGERPSLFSVMKTPPPAFLSGSPADAVTGVSRLQKAALQSENRYLQSYGTDLNAALRYLRSPEAQSKFERFGSF